MRFDKQLKIIKEYYPILILLPTIVGGINQLYNLYIIDAYYVRFLSATQLISDGLWLLLLFTPLYLTLLFSYPIISMYGGTTVFYHRFFPIVNKKLNVRGIIAVNSSLILALVGFVYWGIRRDSNSLNLLLGMIILWYSGMGFRVNLGYTRYFPKLTASYWFQFVYILLLIVGCVGFFKSLFANTAIPSDFANINNVESVARGNFEYHKIKLLYFNDNYTFVRVYCDSINEPSAKTIVAKTDILFGQ